MKMSKAAAGLGLVATWAVAGCTIEHEISAGRDSQALSSAEASICADLLARQPVSDTIEEPVLTDRESRINTYWSTYCQRGDRWAACVGVSAFAMGNPGEACWAEARPVMECLLASHAESAPECEAPYSPRCDPYAERLDQPVTSLCDNADVSLIGGGSTESVLFEFDNCQDGSKYTIACAAPNDACALNCFCTRDDVSTSVTLEAITDGWTEGLWESCGFPAGAGGMGGAPSCAPSN